MDLAAGKNQHMNVQVLMPMNDNRRLNFRISDHACYCGATRAPCSVCENSAECIMCGSIEHTDDMFAEGDDFVCMLCVDRRPTEEMGL